MKAIILIISVGLIATVNAQGPVDTAANVAHSAVNGAKNVAKTAAHGAKNVANNIADAVTPDADARRVDVTMTDNSIDMPTTLEPGKTAFVVKNNGKNTQNFAVTGPNTNRRFVTAPGPGETRVLHVTLKRGKYTAYLPGTDKNKRAAETSLSVK